MKNNKVEGFFHILKRDDRYIVNSWLKVVLESVLKNTILWVILIYMLVCRAVSVEPKPVLTITLKNLLVNILNYLEISRWKIKKKCCISTDGHQNLSSQQTEDLEPASELKLLQQYLFQTDSLEDLFVLQQYQAPFGIRLANALASVPLPGCLSVCHFKKRKYMRQIRLAEYCSYG